MKVNSMAGAIITPIKNIQKSPSCVRAPNHIQKRFSPTKAVQDQLLKMVRCHHFVHHSTAQHFVDMRQMQLKPNHSSQLSAMLHEQSPDLPDFLLKMEEDAISSGEFQPFLRTFLAEQLRISFDLSFAALVIFNYSYQFGIGIEDSFIEVFRLYSEKTICDSCEIDLAPDDIERVTFINIHNLNILKSFQSCDSEMLDDSFNDKEYVVESNDGDSDSLSSVTSNLCKEDDPYMFDKKDENQFINPFLNQEIIPIKGDPISDILPNPFCDIQPVHSTPTKSDITKTICSHCDKIFTKSSNLNTHLGMMSLSLGEKDFPGSQNV